MMDLEGVLLLGGGGVMGILVTNYFETFRIG
jgi:hypothetical protein